MVIIFLKLNEYQECSTVIVDFWNDDTKFVTQIKKKKWIKKNVIIIFKLKLKKKPHHQMKNSIITCIETFSIQRNFCF